MNRPVAGVFRVPMRAYRLRLEKARRLLEETVRDEGWSESLVLAAWELRRPALPEWRGVPLSWAVDVLLAERRIVGAVPLVGVAGPSGFPDVRGAIPVFRR